VAWAKFKIKKQDPQQASKKSLENLLLNFATNVLIGIFSINNTLMNKMTPDQISMGYNWLQHLGNFFLCSFLVSALIAIKILIKFGHEIKKELFGTALRQH